MKTASVIIIHYKSPFLRTAIDSVLEQDYPSVELILIDNNSPAFDSKKWNDYIEKANKGNIVRIIIKQNERNIGVSAAANQAVAYTTGEIVVPLGHDDVFYNSTVISDIMASAVLYPFQIAIGKGKWYDAKLKHGKKIFPNPLDVYLVKAGKKNAIIRRLEYSNFLLGCCLIYNRKFILENGFDERFPNIEDYPLVLKAAYRGEDFLLYDKVITKHREGGISAAFNLNDAYLLEEMGIREKIIFVNTKRPFSAIGKFNLWRIMQKKRRDIESFPQKRSFVYKLFFYYPFWFFEKICMYLI